MSARFACRDIPQELLAHFRGTHCVVTGGLGFIGSHIARALVSAGAEVTLIDACLDGMGANDFNITDFRDRVDLHTVRLSDPGIEDIVAGSTHVFNLAGQISHIDSMTHPLEDLAFNYADQIALLECLRRAAPQAVTVYAGTRQVYGIPVTLPIREDHIVQPVDLNGISKYAAEWAHILYHRVHGLLTVSLRLTNTYGPGQLMRHNRQGFLPWFVRTALEGGCIELFGDGQQTRDINEVTDVVRALLLAASTPAATGQIYNLGHPQGLSLEEIAKILLQLCPGATLKKVPFPADKKKIDLGSTRCDFSKIRNKLGWEPQIEPAEGLAHLVAFAKTHGQHYWP